MENIQDFIEAYEINSFLWEDNMINEGYKTNKFVRFCKKVWNFLTGKNDDDYDYYYSQIRKRNRHYYDDDWDDDDYNSATNKKQKFIDTDTSKISKFIPKGSYYNVYKIVKENNEVFPNLYNLLLNKSFKRNCLEKQKITNYIVKSDIEAGVVVYNDKDNSSNNIGVAIGIILWVFPGENNEKLEKYRELFDDENHNKYAHILLSEAASLFDKKEEIYKKLIEGCIEQIKQNKENEDIDGITVYAGNDKLLEKVCKDTKFTYFDKQNKYMVLEFN